MDTAEPETDDGGTGGKRGVCIARMEVAKVATNRLRGSVDVDSVESPKVFFRGKL